MPKVQTVVDLRNELLDVFHGLRDGTLSAKEAKEMNNAAGKIINSVKVELEYAHLREEKPEIPFLDK
jgi:hypothetical protein